LVLLLARDKQIEILGALCEGNSERAIERMTGVNRETVGRYALRFGEGAQRLHDRLARDMACSLLDLDEAWAFCGKKGGKVTEADGPDVGEQWVWAAIDRLSKFVVSFHVGPRTQESADALVTDLRSRLTTMPMLMTSDGLQSYIPAIVASFGYGATYAQTVKTTRGSAPDHRYAPGGQGFIVKRPILGAPDMALATTYAIERNNLTMRHHVGRMRRLCLAFSKKLPNHRAAVSLCYVYYNMCLIGRGIRMTPAMASNVTNHLWELPELCDALLSEPPGEKPVKVALAHREPEATHRELPGGRGFLRVVGGKGASSAAPMPEAPPPAPVALAVAPAPKADRQLDLFAWKPRPRIPVQGNLFGDPEEVK
jgi:IS1 family transposase